ERLGRRPGRAFTHRLAADAEIVASPSQHHDLGGLGSTEQELGQLDGHGVRGGVPDLWSIKRDFQDRPLPGGENVAGHAWSSQTLPGGAAPAGKMRYLNKRERFAMPANPLAEPHPEPMLRRELERDTRSPLRWDLPCPPPTRRIGHPERSRRCAPLRCRPTPIRTAISLAAGCSRRWISRAGRVRGAAPNDPPRRWRPPR